MNDKNHIKLEKWKKLEPWEKPSAPFPKDWLISKVNAKARVFRGEKNVIVLTNNLVSRSFIINPNGATIGYDNLMSGSSLLRGIKPEAKITLNNVEYEIGGFKGQVEYAYILYEEIETYFDDSESFKLVDFQISPIKKRFKWKRVRNCEDRPWPPKGIELCMIYKPPCSIKQTIGDIKIYVHYECYDGIPLFSKWISIDNQSDKPITLNKYTNEILALVEYMSVCEQVNTNQNSAGGYPHIYFESDYSFGGMIPEQANQTTHWTIDPDFSSQVDFLSKSKNLMQSYLEIGPEMEILPYSKFEGFRDYQLIDSSYDRQRKGLARCQMYRTIAPWITENPLMMHLTSFNLPQIQEAVKQLKEVGFEMLIFSFGSNFNNNVLELGIEHPDWIEDMVEEFKEEVFDPIHKENIDFGGYTLLASRKIGPKEDVVNPFTGKTSDISSPELEDGIEAIQGFDDSIKNIRGAPMFGNSPCIGSNWGKKYFDSLYKMIQLLDIKIIEHDGSYPGDVCASNSHPGHKGLKDSQWTQWKTITDFYKWCRGRGVFLNVPDWYMLTGSNKTGIGYKEVNWSLPRDRQVILGRQNIYDGTWEKTPSMGWTFVPLTVYHSVPEYPREFATLEPLEEHLSHYEAHLAQNLGCGVQACYRGLRLYDSDVTKQLLKKYVDWYKKYRTILESDIVHIRRPDGRNIDGMMHVNPFLKNRGLAIFFNPTTKPIKQILKIPLYYTGIKESVLVSEQEGEFKEYKISEDSSILLHVSIPEKQHTWFLFKSK